jgi:hypothetical protein
MAQRSDCSNYRNRWGDVPSKVREGKGVIYRVDKTVKAIHRAVRLLRVGHYVLVFVIAGGYPRISGK